MRRLAPVAIALAVAFVIALIFWILAVAAPAFMFGYEWPSIKGNGPEDGTSLLLVTVVTGLVYPPTRKWIERELAHVHAKLDHNAHILRHIVEQSPHIDNRILDEHPLPARGRPSKEKV